MKEIVCGGRGREGALLLLREDGVNYRGGVSPARRVVGDAEGPLGCAVLVALVVARGAAGGRWRGRSPSRPWVTRRGRLAFGGEVVWE